MERTQIYRALKKGFRGREPTDLAALEELLVRFSQLVIEQRRIKEIDINPLLVSPKQIDRARCADSFARPEHARRRAAKIDNPAISNRLRDQTKNRRC